MIPKLLKALDAAEAEAVKLNRRLYESECLRVGYEAEARRMRPVFEAAMQFREYKTRAHDLDKAIDDYIAARDGASKGKEKE